jgi:oligopeptide transport system permease protein
MLKYILKRIGLMVLTFFIIQTICFVLIRLIPDPVRCTVQDKSCDAILAWREALGYNKPIIVQYWLFLKAVLTKWDWGLGWKMYPSQEVASVLAQKLPYTIYVNLYSILFAIPLGIIFGIFAALKKNKWQDQVISVLVMLVISVPSFVYCFLIQYVLGVQLGWFPLVTKSGEISQLWFDWDFFHSYIPAILSLGLGTVAGLTRYTRAELTEVLTSDFMLLARAKGLTRRQATWKHALRNSMVPILPMILGEFISVLGGSLIIEEFFSIPGVGAMYLTSISLNDYSFFMFLSMFYVAIGLVANLIIDLSYGFVDPRIRMGAK